MSAKSTKKTAKSTKRPRHRKPDSTRKLSARQETFCAFIAAGETGTDAWLKTGYKVSRDVARTNAAESLAKPHIKARVAELQKPVTAKPLMSRDRKRELLAKIAEGSAKDTDKIRAMEVDAKLAGHFEPDRAEIEIGPKTLLSIKERAALVSSALARKV